MWQAEADSVSYVSLICHSSGPNSANPGQILLFYGIPKRRRISVSSRARRMIFGYEVGSTRVVVIGRSNWGFDPRRTHRDQKRVQKEIALENRERVVVLSVHCLSVALKMITFLAPRCEFLSM